MKLNLRIPLFMTLVVASIGVGTMGVHASTDCQNLFHAYKKQVVSHLHHKVSPATLASWAAWNKAHPHYRPTKKEVIDKINFVCQVPMDDSAIAQDLPPIELPPLLPSMAPPQPNILVSSMAPPDSPIQPPAGDPEYPPVYYPGPPTLFGGGSTPPISPTPEPSSLLLMATAVGLLSGLVFKKRRQSLTA